MWIFLSDSFLSIVANRTGRKLLVRARFKGDIERVFPRARVQETKAADYRFRTLVTRAQVARVLARRIEEIDYHNVKASVQSPERHDAYESVWNLMKFYQRVDLRAPKATC